MRQRIILAALLVAVSASARAANTNLSIIINSPPSTAVNCTIEYPAGTTSFTAPVAAGSTIAGCSVAPAAWSGALTLSGPNAGLFALSGGNLVVGTAAIATPGTYQVTITATP